MSTPTTAPDPLAPIVSPVKTVPTEDEVRTIHTKADVDTSPVSMHHTLGSAPGQATAGNHTHDGGSSAAISYQDLKDQPGIPMIDYNNLMNLPVLNDYNNLINLPYIPPEVKVDSGSIATTAVVASGGMFQQSISFNKYFVAVPAIAVTAGSTRLTGGAVSVSQWGFTVQLSNWTPGLSSSCTSYWTAVGY